MKEKEGKSRKSIGKRGQVQLSFSMIFSIILIIAMVVVAFYVISYFLNLSKCTSIGLFYRSLSEEIDKAWMAEITQNVFKAELPSGIKEVCLGNLTQTAGEFKEEHEALSTLFRHSKSNIFLYPANKACNKEYASFNLKHATTDGFFCIGVIENKAEIKIVKNSDEALVSLESAE